MPGLTPPKDYTASVKVLAIAVLAFATIFAIRANHQPQVGDSSHSLPFGGHYKDGTKEVLYYSQNSKVALKGFNNKLVAFIVCLSILIYASLPRLFASNNVCRICNSSTVAQ
uniref:12 kDa polyprotein n=1 Tax=Potato aucuba mosaic virus TaxID=12182 RepID=A0A291FJ71_PAMV|nr:12 kDa polyprotein [Potato aucuba mosaic virus]